MCANAEVDQKFQTKNSVSELVVDGLQVRSTLVIKLEMYWVNINVDQNHVCKITIDFYYSNIINYNNLHNIWIQRA